uniref:Uncharacterized protein n=1 Tax=Panagrolaimus sp. JU765 TaxID=591449 RepID=A0AC34R5X0_9BILA
MHISTQSKCVNIYNSYEEGCHEYKPLCYDDISPTHYLCCKFKYDYESSKHITVLDTHRHFIEYYFKNAKLMLTPPFKKCVDPPNIYEDVGYCLYFFDYQGYLENKSKGKVNVQFGKKGLFRAGP